jgi:hypothetical protein
MALSNGIRRAPPQNQQVFKDGRASRSFGLTVKGSRGGISVRYRKICGLLN